MGAADVAAAESAMSAAGIGNGGGTGQGSGPGDADSTGGSAGANGGTNSGDARGGGIAKGGMVGLQHIRQFTAGGPNGPGVDDGLVESTVGDFILTARRTKEIGSEAMQALLDGRAEIVMLKGEK